MFGELFWVGFSPVFLFFSVPFISIREYSYTKLYIYPSYPTHGAPSPFPLALIPQPAALVRASNRGYKLLGRISSIIGYSENPSYWISGLSNPVALGASARLWNRNPQNPSYWISGLSDPIASANARLWNRNPNAFQTLHFACTCFLFPHKKSNGPP